MSSTSAGLVLQQEDSVCAYTISGQYGPLVRSVFIIFLLLAIFFQTHPWIFNGAVVSTMLYSLTAAIHALLLIGDFAITNSQIDLDILPAYCITCIAGTAPTQLRRSSKPVKISPRAWLLFVLWDRLLFISSIVTSVILIAVKTPGPPPGGICPTRAGFMRGGQTMVEIEDSFGDYFTKFGNITFVPWILGCIFWAACVVDDQISHRMRFIGFDGVGAHPLSLGIVPPPAAHRVITGCKYVTHYFFWCQLVIYIVAMEVVLYQSRVPVGEGLGAVGQWAPAVSSVLVVVGAGWVAGVPDFDFQVKWLGICAKGGDIRWELRPLGAVGAGITGGGHTADVESGSPTGQE